MVIGGLEKITLIDYPGRVACLVYTVGCNFRCPYCHNPELVDETVETRIQEEDLLQFLRQRRAMLEGVVITGGEPTVHDDLLDFIARIKDLGFLVKLDTNGTNPAVLREALGRRLVDYVAMDVKSPLGRYVETVARPVDVAAIRESIAMLIASPVEHEFRTTVLRCQLSPEDLDEIGREVRGAKRYFLQRFVPTKILNPQFRRKTTYEDHELEEIRSRISNYVDHCAIR